MARELATLRKSPFDKATMNEQSGLVPALKHVIDSAIAFNTDPSGMLRNYLNDTT
jgi:hypothetical protein